MGRIHLCKLTPFNLLSTPELVILIIICHEYKIKTKCHSFAKPHDTTVTCLSYMNIHILMPYIHT